MDAIATKSRDVDWDGARAPSLEAFEVMAQAAFDRPSSIAGLLICGPLHSATPHHAAASVGSRRAASVKDRIASSWLNACENVSP